LQYNAPVVKHQQTDNITALFYVANGSNVLLFFVDAFDKLTDKIMQFVSHVYVSYIQFSIYSVNFTLILRMIAKICKFTAGVF